MPKTLACVAEMSDEELKDLLISGEEILIGEGVDEGNRGRYPYKTFISFGPNTWADGEEGWGYFFRQEGGLNDLVDSYNQCFSTEDQALNETVSQIRRRIK